MDYYMLTDNGCSTMRIRNGSKKTHKGPKTMEWPDWCRHDLFQCFLWVFCDGRFRAKNLCRITKKSPWKAVLSLPWGLIFGDNPIKDRSMVASRGNHFFHILNYFNRREKGIGMALLLQPIPIPSSQRRSAIRRLAFCCPRCIGWKIYYFACIACFAHASVFESSLQSGSMP